MAPTTNAISVIGINRTSVVKSPRRGAAGSEGAPGVLPPFWAENVCGAYDVRESVVRPPAKPRGAPLPLSSKIYVGH